MAMAGKVTVECHCGGVSFPVTPRASTDGAVDITACHCDSCRHVTGELLVSYLPIEAVAGADLNCTSEYATADGWTRRFCPTCGCHVFRSRSSDGGLEWEVATGILVGPVTSDNSTDPTPKPQFKRHAAVSSTRDGGASVWLPEIDGYQVETLSEGQPEDHGPETTQTQPHQDSLPASCDCGTVTFRITRPDETSLLPRSYLPDLTHAYCSTDPAIVANNTDTKWWMRPGGKYLAGTCACRTCRLVSGFEIQTWAFVPRSNIYFRVPASKTAVVPLDFATLPPGILKSYASSADVFREFCGRCGATVFWRGRHRPELIDVSVGLLRGEGARVEGWLEWWTGRVSFSEEAERGRVGAEAERTRDLVSALERGLEVWSHGG